MAYSDYSDDEVTLFDAVSDLNFELLNELLENGQDPHILNEVNM